MQVDEVDTNEDEMDNEENLLTLATLHPKGHRVKGEQHGSKIKKRT